MLHWSVNGICLEYDFRALIITGAGAVEAAGQTKWPVVAQGEIDLHLGVALFDRPFVFTPTHIITERQQTIEGEAVFDWLVEGCYRMPRSEVFGVDAHGKEAQVFARDIDIEESPIALYGSGTWIVSLIEIDPALNVEVQRLDLAELPDRFRKALKGYRAGPMIDWTKQAKQWIGAR
jgi:hypothetical protein